MQQLRLCRRLARIDDQVVLVFFLHIIEVAVADLDDLAGPIHFVQALAVDEFDGLPAPVLLLALIGEGLGVRCLLDRSLNSSECSHDLFRHLV